MTLLLATTNPNKLREMRPLLEGIGVEVVTLADLPPVPEPAETGATFWETAREKALAYAAATGLRTVAEDSGIEIEALGGEPGVRSARFLGPDASYPARFAEIFRRLAGLPGPYRARFVTALAVAESGEILFESEAQVAGVLADSARGERGFGYDPIFLYPPFSLTTGEMPEEDKAAISHRARAFRDLRRAIAGGALGGPGA